MPSNLSLGKLKRAVDGTDSYTTANTSLAAQNDGSSETKMSDFSCGTIGSLGTTNSSGGPGASGTLTLGFSGQGSLFNTKIRNRTANFVWSDNDTLNVATLGNSGVGDYNISFSIGSGPPVTAAFNFTVKFKEDGQTDGFNSAASGYNTNKNVAFTFSNGA